MKHRFVEKQNAEMKIFNWIFHEMQLSTLILRSLQFIVVTYVTFFTIRSWTDWAGDLHLYPLTKSSWTTGSKSYYTYQEDIILLIWNINLNKLKSVPILKLFYGKG